MPRPSAGLRRRVVVAIGLLLVPVAARAQVVAPPREGRRIVIPPQVESVLRAIDETGQAPPGHIGGGDYHNSGRRGEQLLPKIDREGDAIAYRTWDVRPTNQGRGAERVVTGSDGSAYYTPDDYRTFVTVRNPARSTHDGADHARTPPPPPPSPGQGQGRDREPARPGDWPVVALDPRTAARVMPVVDYVLARGEPPADHVGGRDYRNLGLDGGEVLPRFDAQGRLIRYREWDVNRRMPGRNRGAERLVTGSDGRVYYTNDHYATFRRIR
jgi:guanyl-specific ribonuclease Sa